MRIATLSLASVIATALVGGAAVPVIAGPGRLQHSYQTGDAAPMHVGTQRPSQEVRLSVGEGQLITLPAAATNVWVSAPDVADVYVSNPRQVHLFGKAFGEATVFATGAGGAVIYSATIRVSQNITSVDKMLQVAMPGVQMQVVMVGQIAVLTGTVASPDDAATAKQLVTAYLNPGVDVSAAGAMLKIGVISRLKTATPLQVNLRVRFAEVSRSFVKNIGVNFQNRGTGNANPFFGISQGRQGAITTVPGNRVDGQLLHSPTDAAGNLIPYIPSGLFPGQTQSSAPVTTGIGSTLSLASHLFGADVLASLDLGETIGQVSTLAEPNVTTLSGETATFLAGGEIPIPVSQGLGAVSVEYKQYGISLAYTPTVLSNGRISLRVRPEVSQLSSQGAVTISGTTIPALSTRRIETSAELGSGESLVIGGLLQNDHNNSITKTPGLGDVPILGALFRDNAFQRNETELVVVITPYLVHPVNANDIVLPTDGYQAPTDLQRIFDGKLGGGRTGGDRPKPTIAPPLAPAGPREEGRQARSRRARFFQQLMPARGQMTMIRRSLLLTALVPAVALAGCSGTLNRGLDSVHQPVVSRTDYSFDVGTGDGGLAPGEAARLAGWMSTVRLGYGDRVSIDDPADDRGARDAVAGEVARFGLLLAATAPVTGAPVAPGTIRVVVSRAVAFVPHCPDYTRNGSHEFQSSTTSNFGCAANSNLAAMVADPNDLVRGETGVGTSDPLTNSRAIDAYRRAAPTGSGGTAVKSDSASSGAK